jgi:AcrR family transcriptional regulator
VTAPDDRETAILEAAERRFARHGFRRTSMEDIAAEAGIARPTLYLYFDSKEDIFRSLSQRLHERALARAEAALAGEAPLAERLAGAFAGFRLDFLELVASWPNAAELIDESHRIGADISLASVERFRKLLAAALRRAAAAGEIDLARAGLTAPRAAELLERAALGLKDAEGGIDAYRRRMDDLLRLFAAAVAAD